MVESCEVLRSSYFLGSGWGLNEGMDMALNPWSVPAKG